MKIYSAALKLATTAVLGLCGEVVHGHGVNTLRQNATATALPPRSLRRRNALAFRDIAANTTVAGPSFDKREQNAPAITTATSRHLQDVWVKVGADIDGEATGDNFGWQVALSNDGTIVAIGARIHDSRAGNNNGYVRVLQLVEGSWERMGEDISGEVTGDRSGWALDLSADGSIVAIGEPGNDQYDSDSGRVRILKYDGSSWIQLGGDVGGEVAYDYSGESVSLSADGFIVAIGTKWNDGDGGFDNGHVRVYEYDGSSCWIQLGGDVDGEGECDDSGTSVSLSADGSIVAIGAPLNDGNGEWSGHVRIYKFDGSSWIQLGGDLDGEDRNDWSGISIDLSDDGDIVAIGATLNNGNGPDSGHVRIYNYNGTSWNKVGGDLDGEGVRYEIGISVALSSNGSIVAIGGDGKRLKSSGHVRIYKFDGASWDRVGTDFNGEANDGDRFGYSVDISSDGTIVAIGAPGEAFNATSSGNVRVFEQPPDPTMSPTNAPTGHPTKSVSPSKSNAPSDQPTDQPPTNAPLGQPIVYVVSPAPTPVAPTPTAGGCYEIYVDGFSHTLGDWVSATVTTISNPIYTQDSVTGAWKTTTTTTTTKRNYKCISKHWCGMSGYKPGSTGESLAWQKGIECSGTATAPTPHPWNPQGGCPRAYEAGTNYDAWDVVAVDNLVYQCASGPKNLFCGQTGFAPGKDQFWDHSWTMIGSCFGTLTPSSSPNFAALTNLGGCPEEWEEKNAGEEYEEDDKVSSQGLVFSCKRWPYSGHCGQQGYKPMTNPATPDAWKAAWSLTGYCDGSYSPTSSPNFDPNASVGACPDEWSAGINVKYEESDMVSVTVSTVPLRKVAFRCKSWPYSGHCSQFPPTNVPGGLLGWSFAGSCDGSIGPTASPSFNKLAVTTGCPAEYSASSTDYEAGDLVAYTVSTTPERKTVYMCRAFPNVGYCNQSGFKPGSQYDYMGWKLISACSGSLAPTIAPAVYARLCTYTKCVEVDDIEQCTPGSTGCSCDANDMAGLSCQRDIKREVCSDVAVSQWSESVDYTTGDVVRVGTKRFNCREWPNYLWCSMPAYKPTLENNGIWHKAWSEDGTCT